MSCSQSTPSLVTQPRQLTIICSVIFANSDVMRSGVA